MDLDRRRVFILSAALAAGCWPAGAVALEADDGSPIRSAPAPDLGDPPGGADALAVGAEKPDVTLVEVFDYNCAYCRMAGAGLDALVQEDKGLRLVLLHNPILSAASLRAARVVVAAQRAHGVAAAYRLHSGAFDLKGLIDEPGLLAAAAAAGLDAAKIADVAQDPATQAMVQRQQRLARDAGLRFTPSFVLADRAFIGWPGVATTKRFIRAARRCGSLSCVEPPPGRG